MILLRIDNLLIATAALIHFSYIDRYQFIIVFQIDHLIPQDKIAAH